jgi:hypothetical protein
VSDAQRLRLLSPGARAASRGGVKVAVTSRKVASEKSGVPTSALENELNLFVLFFPYRLVLIVPSRYTQP